MIIFSLSHVDLAKQTVDIGHWTVVQVTIKAVPRHGPHFSQRHLGDDPAAPAIPRAARNSAVSETAAPGPLRAGPGGRFVGGGP